MDTMVTCIANAKIFLKENPNEIIACATQIFQLLKITLYNSITRSKKLIKKTGKHNKILKEYQVKAMYKFIQLLLAYSI